MQVTETNAEGLKREFKIVIPAGDIAGRVDTRLKDLSQTIRLPGFRPGKVPLPLLKKRYGASVMGEVIEQALNDTTTQAFTDRGLRPATQPKIEITSYEEGKDLEFTVAMEVLPEIEPVDFSAITVEKPVVQISDEEVDAGLKRLAQRQERSEPAPEGHKAETGDVVVIDFVGKLDGEPFEGGKGEGYPLKLGSNSFIPGFEDQLVGVAAGEQRTVKVTFPGEYHAEHLAGKEAEFDVTVKEVRQATTPAIDDDLAKAVGIENLEELRKAVREQMDREYAGVARTHMKRKLLDALAERHDFAVPQGMVEMEFDAIWKQVEQDRQQGRLDPDDQGKSEDELKAEYRKIAERRVRLGLLLSEVGRRNNITVTQEDLNRALVAEARRFPGQEHMVFQYYQQNPDAMNMLRAPVYEDKVVDFILELAKTEEKPVTPEELMKLPEAEKGEAA